MPRPRFEALDPKRRQQILENASAAFQLGGLHGASLNQILAATGISKGVFYYYFDNKMDLYGTIVEQAICLFETVFAVHPPVEALSHESFWRRLELSYLDLYAFSVEHASVVRLVKTLDELRPEEVALLGADTRCLCWLQRYLERGQTLGLIRDDLPMHVLMDLASAVDSSIGRWLFANVDVESEALEERVSNLVGMYRRILAAEVRFRVAE